MAFEWPKGCEGWIQEEILDSVIQNRLYECTFDGCYFGMKDDEGNPILKSWRVVTNDLRLAHSLNQRKCKHAPGFRHSQVQGKYADKTAFYPEPLCESIATAL